MLTEQITVSPSTRAPCIHIYDRHYQLLESLEYSVEVLLGKPLLFRGIDEHFVYLIDSHIHDKPGFYIDLSELGQGASIRRLSID